MSSKNNDNHTDQQLAAKVLQGDTAAFAHIIHNTEALVAQIVFKMISNPEDRKDIAQDIYLKAFKNLAGFRFQSKLSTWIAQIAYNTSLNYLEKKKLILVNSWGDENATQDEAYETTIHHPDAYVQLKTTDTITQKEVATILQSEINLLTPIHKTLVTLYHAEEMSYAELSQVTGLPEGTVKSYLFRARKKLHDALLSKYKKEDLC